ncbi:MAG: DUF6267 family protein, partial [Candidatus Nitrosomaritimum aestuariumsis]
MTEKKNTHLQHIEDQILIDGPKGVKTVINFLTSLTDMVSGSVKEEVIVLTERKGIAVTLKWDGSPAVIAGIDPATKKFFVGTKSVFSKGNPKLNFTDKDIDRNHGGNGDLPNKLKSALKYLPSIWNKGVFQGDMMFDKSILKRQKIDGKDSITFKPNTILYSIPADTDLGKKIAGSKFGIVFHTKYTGQSMEDMSASFNVTVGDFKQSKDVWFD